MMETPSHSSCLLRLCFRACVLGGWLLFATRALVSHAQITLDGTLGPKGPLTGPDYTIGAEVGQLRGANLFHSFGDFNIHTGESATFTGPNTVNNIVGRVTGGNQSFIDGTLRSAIPEANLYLLNPSGVLFGPEARLNVPGSFHVSTADYLKLRDEGRFDATTPSHSVLTSAPPAAFGFLGSNPAPIAIQGSALQVPEGKTLSVIGGDIQITGGKLSAPGGQLNLASVASAGEVIPTLSEHGPDLKMEGFSRLGKIEASQGAHINTDGTGGGSVLIRGGRLVVDNATISSNTHGNMDGAQVGIEAQIAEDVVITNSGRIETTVTGAGNGGAVQLTAGSVDGSGSATVGSTTTNGSTGNGGSTELKVKQLTLTDGARVDTSTSGDGRGGALSVAATDSVSISGRDSKGVKSGLFSNALGKGDAGNLSVSAPTLTMSDRGTIDAHTAGDGNAGNVDVQAGTLTLADGAQIQARSGVAEYKEGVFSSNGTGGPGRGGDVTVQATESISITGGDSDGTPSWLASDTVNKGDAGKLFVSAPLLQIDGGIISASTLGDGNGGNIDVQVGQLTLTGGVIASGVGIRQFITNPFLLIYTGGPGRGGNLTVHATESISLFGGSFLTTRTGGKGDAGELFVSAPVLLIDGRGTVGGIGASTLAEGNAGNIDVQVGKLTLQNGGLISSGVGATVPDGKGGLIFIGVDDSGRGGNLTVYATEAISISGQSSLGQQSGLFTSAVKGSGGGGQILVSAPFLGISDGGTIFSGTLSSGNAGDIDVQVGKLTLQNGSGISSGVGATVPDGKGGIIFIGVDDSGRGGNLTVHATESISISGAILIPGQSSLIQPSALSTITQKGSGDGGNVFVSTPELQLTDNGGVFAGTLSKGNAGDIRLEVGRLTADSGSIIGSGTTGDGNGGDIKVRVGTLMLSNGGRISASAEGNVPQLATGGPGRAGNITVIATDSISIAGSDSDGFTSGLFTDAFKGSGDGGQILVSAPFLDISDGGEILSASLHESTGNAGGIELEVGKLTMSGDANISTSTEGPGQGGDIHIQARQIELNNNTAAITASSFGSGDAGNIEIHVDDTFRSRNSAVSTSSTQSGGGKIDLSAGQIVELVDSQVTTTVQGGAGDAGNITIDPRYVVLNDSQVIARAVEGNGGNVRIDADVFIASPTSVVDASSQTGISGAIDIRGVVNNLSGSIAPLPHGYLSTAGLTEDRCAGRLRKGQVSSFVIAGRDGMPLQPGGLLPSPLYEAHQMSAQGRAATTDIPHVVWQVSRITPVARDGGCAR